MEFLFFAIVFGLVCMYLAGNKKRNQLIAFLAGFFLGIFALIYYIAIPTYQAPNDPARI